jgi:hypothetical protein
MICLDHDQSKFDQNAMQGRPAIENQSQGEGQITFHAMDNSSLKRLAVAGK